MAKRRPVNVVRDYPKGCGLGVSDAEEHHSPIKQKSGFKEHDDNANSKQSPMVPGKRPLEEDNCNDVDDDNHDVYRPVRQCRVDAVRDYPQCFDRFSARDKEVKEEVDPQNDSVKSKMDDSIPVASSNLHDQAKTSKGWDFEWVEVDRTEVMVDDSDEEVDDDNEVSFFSPDDLSHKSVEETKNNTSRDSGNFTADDVTDDSDEEADDDDISLVSPDELLDESVEETKIDESRDVNGVDSETRVHEVLNLYHKECAKLYGVQRTNQIHLKAAIILKKEGKWLNCENTIGHVPGVNIGDQFQYRAELVVVGLHHEFLNAISCSTIGDKDCAFSIVDTDLYENKGEPSNVLTYAVQGVNSQSKCSGNKGLIQQKGKLAMKNSMDAKLPVRVIRKLEVEDKKVLYFYDGLYNISRSWEERSKPCKTMFKLNRLQGQVDIDCSAIRKQRDSVKYRNRVVITEDLSGGKEKYPILVVNDLNDEKPEPFTYVSEMVFTRNLHKHPSIPRGCECVGGCSDLHKCACVKKNLGQIPFNEEGAILKAKSKIYECGPNCKCPPSCPNRVTQHGPKLPLEVFKTRSTGWGVRSREEIRSGSFICEYLGELMEDLEADSRTDDDYLLDLDDGTGYTIDAAKCGNIGRFINHSCSPNLYAQNVFYDHEDMKMPHVMFFATKTIPALQELTYHYDYKINSVRDANGNIKKKKCCCGSRYCKRRLY